MFGDFNFRLDTNQLVKVRFHLLVTDDNHVGRHGRMFESVCLFVCPEYNSKTNDPKVFKLGIGNDLRIP